ncbi:MAG: leucine--tRNA ligase [Candidatus Aenigmarchaeota archaeon]|nr:leucine--tRNA ligase [Candidatus Aenigmarchaeota archaeon]
MLPGNDEKKWQRVWKKKKIFEPSPDFGKKSFFFTVPYPYTSGTLHVGHGRTYTLGDITARFMRMQGFNVLWPLGFHITGTPILAVSKRIENREKNVIKEHEGYVSLHDPKKAKEIVASFIDPSNVAEYYASVISKDMDELGCSIDWRRDFTTGDKIYNQFIKWQYSHLNKLGYLKKGEHAVFFCPADDNPVTTDDVRGGDEISMTIEKFFLIKEKMDDGFIVAATLRPETIFGVTNVWVNREAGYVKASVNGEVWYISEKAAEKLKNQNMDVKIIKKMNGEELLGKDVTIPIAGQKVKIFPSPFVDENVATGVVNSVPAHAPYDYIALKTLVEAKMIKPVSVITADGKEASAVGMCESMGIKSLDETGKLEKATKDVYAAEFYKGVTNKNCGPFSGLKVSDAKQKIFDELSSKGFGALMYENATTDMKGLPTKILVCRCGSDVMIKVIKDQWFLDYSDANWKKAARKLLARMEITPAAYRKQFEESISWLHEWACARRRGLGTKLPYDEKWVIESLSDSTIYMAFYTVVNEIKKNKIKPESLTEELFDYVFLGKGEEDKVLKSSGVGKKILAAMRGEFSYWYPLDERRTAPAHIPNHLTFFLFHHAAVFPETMWPRRVAINELLIAEGRKMSKSLGNVIPLASAIRKHGADAVRLYLAHSADAASTLDWRENGVENVNGRLERFCEIVSKQAKPLAGSLTGEWFVNEFYQNLGTSERIMKGYGFRAYIQKMFFDTLRNAENLINRTNDYGAVQAVAKDWILALSPVIPHTCEGLWNSLGQEGLISVQMWPQQRAVDRQRVELELMFSELVKDLNQLVKIAGRKKNAFIYAKTEDEKDYISESLEHLKSAAGFDKITVYGPDDEKMHDPAQKAVKAKQGRPGIYLE